MTITIEIGKNLQAVLWGVGSLPFCWFAAKWLYEFCGGGQSHD